MAHISRLGVAALLSLVLAVAAIPAAVLVVFQKLGIPVQALLPGEHEDGQVVVSDISQLDVKALRELAAVFVERAGRCGSACVAEMLSVLWSSICVENKCLVLVPRTFKLIVESAVKKLEERGIEVEVSELSCTSIEQCSLRVAEELRRILLVPEVVRELHERGLKLVLLAGDHVYTSSSVKPGDKIVFIAVSYPATYTLFVTSRSFKLGELTRKAVVFLDVFQVDPRRGLVRVNDSELLRDLEKLVSERARLSKILSALDIVYARVPDLEISSLKQSSSPGYVPGGVMMTIYVKTSTDKFESRARCTVGLPVLFRAPLLGYFWWMRGFLTAGHCGIWGGFKNVGFIAGVKTVRTVSTRDLDALQILNPSSTVFFLVRRADMSLWVGMPTAQVHNTKCSLVYDYLCRESLGLKPVDGVVTDFYRSVAELARDLMIHGFFSMEIVMQKGRSCCWRGLPLVLIYSFLPVRVPDLTGRYIIVFKWLLMPYVVKIVPGDSGSPVLLHIRGVDKLKFIGTISGYITIRGKPVYILIAPVWDALVDLVFSHDYGLTLAQVVPDTDCGK